MDRSDPAASKASFAPEADPRARVLVLGSLPGEISLRRGQYYANPQNQFWRLMQAVVGVELDDLPYEARLAALKSAHVGLWDVIHSAERRGSLDATIRAHRPNALTELLAGLPELRAVAFNGGKAFAIGRRTLAGEARVELVPLPSSSPAHTAPFERKLEQWMALRRFLQT